jgi:Ca2+-binding RTX toxin-like protein
MSTLTAYTDFDSRVVTAFSATTESLTIARDSEIALSDAENPDFSVVFTGSFKPINAKGGYGTAKLLSFYSATTLAYSIAGAWPLTVDLTAETPTLDFPDTEGFSDIKLFAGNDNYIGSAGNDWFDIYDNRGRNVYYGMDGNDYIELSTDIRGVASGGDGNDLIVSSFATDRLSGGDGDDLFYLGKLNVTLTDFAVADDSIVLPKSYFEEKLLKSWLVNHVGESPVQFETETVDDLTTYAFPVANIAVVEGIKSAKGLDANFIYDLGSGKLYFDQDGAYSKTPVLLATLQNKPLLEAEDIAASLVFIGDIATYRDSWEATYFAAEGG